MRRALTWLMALSAAAYGSAAPLDAAPKLTTTPAPEPPVFDPINPAPTAPADPALVDPVPSDVIPCGGLLGLRCPSERHVCIYPQSAQCGAADAPGVCTAVPDACITLYDPVCGCDGQTYGNSCFAMITGVSVASTGECKPPPEPPTPCPPPPPPAGGEMCGGIAGIACKRKGEFCHYKPGTCLTIADAAGTCTKRPERCVFLRKPVCGCDGQTYPNACWAKSAGASVACDGRCPCARANP